MARFSIENYIAGVIYSAPSFLIPLMVVNMLGAESGAYFRIAFGIASIFWQSPFLSPGPFSQKDRKIRTTSQNTYESPLFSFSLF